MGAREGALELAVFARRQCMFLYFFARSTNKAEKEGLGFQTNMAVMTVLFVFLGVQIAD